MLLLKTIVIPGLLYWIWDSDTKEWVTNGEISANASCLSGKAEGGQMASSSHGGPPVSEFYSYRDGQIPSGPHWRQSRQLVISGGLACFLEMVGWTQKADLSAWCRENEEKTEPRSTFTKSGLPEILLKTSHEKKAEKPVRCVTGFSFSFCRVERSCGMQCQCRERDVQRASAWTICTPPPSL